MEFPRAQINIFLNLRVPSVQYSKLLIPEETFNEGFTGNN